MSSSGRINNLRDPSATQDAATKSYVDSKTTDMATNASVATATTNMATTSSVTTAITNALNNGSMTNNPTVADNNDSVNYRLLYTAQSSGRATLYNDGQLTYNPSTNTLTAGTFSGTLSADSGTFSSWIQVSGSQTGDTRVGSQRFYAFDAAGSQIGGVASTSISIISEHGIWMKGSAGSGRLWMTSDQRIKTNIVNLNADKMMNIFRTLRPISFDYIDNMKTNNKKKLGFIAQEINEILPEGITLNTDVIPNNMLKGEIDQTSEIEASFTLKPDDTDITLQYLLLTTDSSLNFDTVNPYSSTDVYKFKVYCGKEWVKEQDIYIRSDYNVTDDKYTYVIGMKKDVYDIVITEPTLFVYGQYVYDLHILDHDTIYTVATAALQEVDREQQADKARIAELEAKVIHFESKIVEQQSLINDILERLKTLEKA